MDHHSRRSFLLLGLGFLAGCAGQSASRSTASSSGGGSVRGLPEAYSPSPRPPIYRPGTGASGSSASVGSPFPGVISRTRWCTGDPIPSKMDRLTGVRLVTVHHDGMSPWYASAENDTGARIDAIRRSHQQSNGWGDIGYHFVVDRAGRIWEGRPLVYQGAHVKYHNPGNIGVLCLGNFDRQDPTERQVAALERHLQALMNHYRVPVKLVHTHQELRPTACPGRSLQGAVNSMRWSGRLA